VKGGSSLTSPHQNADAARAARERAEAELAALQTLLAGKTLPRLIPAMSKAEILDTLPKLTLEELSAIQSSIEVACASDARVATLQTLARQIAGQSL